jgi:hypothetical protein
VLPIGLLLVEGTDGVAARKRTAELGRLLADAVGYQVRSGTGGRLGRVEHVRYRHHADRPDEIIVRGPALLRGRKRAYPLSTVREVNRKNQTVVIAVSSPSHPAEPADGSTTDPSE